MSGMAWLAVGIAVGAILGLAWRWRRAIPGSHSDVPAPEPVLRWLARSAGALGAWLSTPGRAGDLQRRWRREMPAEARLDPGVISVVEARLAALRGQQASGAERLDAGTLLYAAAGESVVGVLLPAGVGSERLREVGDDLVALLESLSTPAPDPEHGGAGGEVVVESVGSIGLRLAYQLERVLHAEVIVALTTQVAVRVIGTSSRADRRLLDAVAQPGSPMYQVARGEVTSLTSIADPLGGIVHDRRTHQAPAILVPIRHADEPVGAVAFWGDDDGAPIAPVIAEVQEALRNAGPRLVRARALEEQGNAGISDALTGLRNARGLTDAMHRHGSSQGTLIHTDLDKFRLLNEQLGAQAGDAALIHFARVIHDQIRGGDTGARVDGGAFAIWLPGASLVFGARVAERIRIRLATTPWDWQGRSWPLSASFGVAGVPDSARSPDSLGAQADAALSEAKRQGRDRVEVARPVG
jgi:diguanylate cyclase (GGDEF)-like protein